MAGRLQSASSKSRKKNCKCSKGRSIPLFTAWNSKAGSKRNGAAAKPVARQSFIHSRAQAESTWKKRRRTGTDCLGRLIWLFAPLDVLKERLHQQVRLTMSTQRPTICREHMKLAAFCSTRVGRFHI